MLDCERSTAHIGYAFDGFRLALNQNRCFMSDVQPPRLPASSRRDAVLLAQRFAGEYRLFAAHGEELYFPRPAAKEREAYRVLLDLKLINALTFQWSARGRHALALSDENFNAIFEFYLKRMDFIEQRRSKEAAPGNS